MQSLGQKFDINFIKTIYRKSNLFKKLISQEINESIGLRKKKFTSEFPEFWIRTNSIPLRDDIFERILKFSTT